MEGMQQLVKPIAKVALAQLAFKLVRLLQAQLAQGKKPVRAAPQIFVGAGRQPVNRQIIAHWKWMQRRCSGQHALAARVGRQWQTLQQQRLYKGAGHQVLAAFGLPPQKVNMRRLQGVLPGSAMGKGDFTTRGKAQQFTLGCGPLAGRLR